ncbi:hypothetical protein Y032_0154g3002 [Ancylostoma ceylanicum]|uniref:Reverse transcriptase domain-containing protein n=1 Tax=Ancylostoma ceylanicum TaxID=53326 RepID=A0A016T028_9BILA|nr:hypothetical protein Y032_0154g3002 [Ancylostoma ceylanicum]
MLATQGKSYDKNTYRSSESNTNGSSLLESLSHDNENESGTSGHRHYPSEPTRWTFPCKIPSRVYYASFDVESLYTNVNNDNAVKAVISLYGQHESQIHSMGFNADDIRVMLSATLSCNIFCFNNKMYEQKRGLGNRIAPLLAIISMDHMERITLTSNILLYKRYVDDALVIGISKNEVERKLEGLNAVDDNILYDGET